MGEHGVLAIPMQDASGERDVLERWAPVWHIAFYAMLAFPTAATVWGVDPSAIGALWKTGALVAALAIWHWVMVVRRPHGYGRVLPNATYFGVASTLALLLMRQSPVFVMTVCA